MTGAHIRLGCLVVITGILAAGGSASRATHVVNGKPHQPWKTGYWVWAGESPAPAGFMPDILYVETPPGRWPRGLPPAYEYVVVRRIEADVPLTPAVAAAVVDDYKALVADAGPRVRISGLQIDYDSPARLLDAYGVFLAQLRQRLPPSDRLSITALLDWFHPYAGIDRVLQAVDEFVPQFYDTAHERTSAGIAEPIDPSRWAPVFNAYHVPYRIGVATFGRIARRRLDDSGHTAVRYFRDASPIDFFGPPHLDRRVLSTPAGELVVHYDVRAHVPGQPELRAGDAVEITFPTQVSVRAAYDAAHRFGGYCAGVLAFRWPGRSETLTLGPDDVEQMVSDTASTSSPRLETREARCIERTCQDLYLNTMGILETADRTIGIRATAPLDVFLPAGGPIRTSRHGQDLFVRLPAYAGLGTLYVGRAISHGPVGFEVMRP